jgi:hypothetical protein
MTWQRKVVTDYLVTLLTNATEGAVKVHPFPPETINGPCIVVMRPQPSLYSTVAFGIDDTTLPLSVVSGAEQEDALDSIKAACRSAIEGDPTLGGNVQQCFATEERNWRNVTGAGGIQLLIVEMILTVYM